MIPEKVISPALYNGLCALYVLLFIGTVLAAHQGMSFWDDFSYLSLAHDINKGDFEVTTNHFTSRITLLYPVAYIIKYLGISAYTATLFPLLCGIVLLRLICWLGKLINHWIGVIGGALFLADYHMIHFSNHLFPEMPMALLVFLVLMSYYLVLKGEMVPRLAALLAALALFGAFLTKTTVIMLLPLLLYLFILDRRKHRNGSFWLVFIALSVFFFLLNGFWYYEVKGNFFYRFQNIADNHVATAKSFFDKGTGTILARLTYLPLLGFLKGGFFIPLLLALPAMLKLRKAQFKLEKAENLWPLASVFLLAGFWFMSTSWRYYSPLPTEPRHIVFFIPVFIMTAATFWPHQKLFLYFNKKVFVLLAALAVLSIPVYAITQRGKKNFTDERELVTRYFVEDKSEQVIITDGLTTYGHPFYYRFEQVEDEYYWFSELEEEWLDELFESGKTVYLLVNRAHFNEYYDDSENFEKFWNRFVSYHDMAKLPVTESGAVQLYVLTGDRP